MTSPAPEAPASSSSTRSPFFWPVVIVLVVLGLLASTAGMAWVVYVKHSDHTIVRKAADILPIPAAKLGSTTILYRDFLKARDTLKIFLNSPAAKEQNLQVPIDNTLEQNVLEKQLVQATLEELAQKRNVTVTDTELRKYFSEVIAAASSTTPDVGVYLLENFGWNEEDFRQQVLKPALLEQRLAIALTEEQQGNEDALGITIENRLKEKDVVRYLRF